MADVIVKHEKLRAGIEAGKPVYVTRARIYWQP